MATLQKFKLLATQCAVAAGSPTRSPTTSPVIHLRRRKTLRMLLTRSGNVGSDGGSDRRLLAEDDASPDGIFSDGDSPDKKEVVVRNKLKDLFVSSPEHSREGFSPEISSAGGSIGSAVRRIRPLTATFRQRLLRRVWRPMLVSIPE
ncbi:uncharacterized protein LOC107802116 [Nicotiana tabacum]|uniref:Uncharacterized protein LOC107802116 n=1 Tax=Nicotiana tabacum TaxID=4097 RepID=A0A1S4AWQ2_TOBAC|nr:PREDICTED: uncharacterized protein LOC107802116 [Nicotiana tabacum]